MKEVTISWCSASALRRGDKAPYLWDTSQWAARVDVISPVHMPPPSLCSFHYSVQFCSLLCEGGRSCDLWSNTGPPHTCYLLSHVQLCDPMDCNLCPWDSLGKNTGVGCHCLLQGIFPSQGLNLGLPHCRQILYRLSHQGSPRESISCYPHIHTRNPIWSSEGVDGGGHWTGPFSSDRRAPGTATTAGAWCRPVGALTRYLCWTRRCPHFPLHSSKNFLFSGPQTVKG